MSFNYNTENEKESVEPVTANTGLEGWVNVPPLESKNVQMELQGDEAVVMETTNLSAESVTEQNVSFLDATAGATVSAASSVSPVAKVDGTNDLSLGEFLSRPTLIDTHTWATTDVTGVFNSFKPWHLFLSDARIQKKIDNFAFIRGRLHVKTILNGTPFQYGLMRYCYHPLVGVVTNKVRNASAQNVLAQYSQMPGFYIRPTDSSGGEMVLPFFYHKNWLDLTVSLDVQNFGTMYQVIFAPLAVAVSGGTSTVTVQTYAWMTDVELMATTSALALQGDEYVEGPISSVATGIARVAGALKNTPVIGKFARATELGAQAAGKIASLFGFTNVPVIEPVHGFHPMNAPMLASAGIGTAVQKLTLDPKQELSIDPTLHGIDSVDELAISSIAKHEGYFGSTVWATSDAVDSLLYTALVNPATTTTFDVINNTVPTPVGVRVFPTPLGYLSNLFRHWRGSMKLHMRIVCSKFHKGRLKIMFDPDADLSVVNPTINTVYTQIVDIGEQDDVIIDLPYHQPTAWCGIPSLQDTGSLASAGGPIDASYLKGWSNGTVSVRVLTTLTAPSASQVTLLFYWAGGDDIQFANPTDIIANGDYGASLLALQGEEKISASPEVLTMGTPGSISSPQYGMNFGEAIESLRLLLHRSSVRNSVILSDQTASRFNVNVFTLRIMPPSTGYDSTAQYTANKIVAASGTQKYWIAPLHPMTYISSAFLGYRGSANFTITPGSELVGNLNDIRVVRGNSLGGSLSAPLYLNSSFSDSSSDSSLQAGFDYRVNRRFGGNSGMGITSTTTNGSLLFNLPDFKKFNFSLVEPSKYIAGSSLDDTTKQYASVLITTKANATTDLSHYTVQIEEGAGPDFTCLFFLCAPVLDILMTYPSFP